MEALYAHIAEFDIQDGGPLFTHEGKGITRARLGRIWRPTAAATKLTAATGTGMHSLRHYYASLLIRHEESVKVVQARLGHASAAETPDTYSHLWPDSDDRMREAIDAMLGADRSTLAESPADSSRTGATA